jgi:hypothetical protein
MTMVRFYQHYLTYRSVGIARADALRFAWMVAVSGATPVPVRAPRRT